LLERVGSGGFGSVWKAWDEQLKRVVAVKIPRGLQLSHHEQQRFLHEARAAARLRHRYILDIHEVGFEDDEVFLVSDYLPGGSLADLLARSALTPKEAARLCQKVAEGLHAAHEAGIIHRDVKPQNILLDEQGEPRLADFELALPESGEISVTIEGDVLGTPAYMSPEQAAGHSQQADRRSDVYSLGVVLYQMLSGQLPFRGNWTTLASQIANDTPPSPRKFQPFIPADLERICLKCLEKDPRRRYPTAAEFAEELGRFLRGEPVLARPVSRPERIWRWAKRRPAVAALAAVVTVLALTILVGAPLMALRLALTSRAEQQSRLQAEDSLRRLEIRRVRELFAGDRASEGLALLSRLVRENPTQEALASWLMNELTHRNFARPVLPALEHPDIVNSAQFSPDGRWLLTVCRDNAARIFDVMTGRMLTPPLRHDPAGIHGDQYRGGLHALHADISPDGTCIATGSCDGTARLWDAATGEPLTPPLAHPDYVSYVRFSPDAEMFVTCCKDGKIRFWETASGKPTGKVFAHRDWANSAEFSSDGRLLVTTSDDKTAQVWEVDTGTRFGSPMRRSEMIQHACFSRDGRRVLTTGANVDAQLWVLGQNDLGPVGFLTHRDNVPYACFSPDGRWAGTVSFDGTAAVWDAHHGDVVCQMRHRDRVRFVQFSSDGLRCLTASEDGTARIWDSQTGQPVTEPMRHAGTVWCARFSPDGRLVATASADGTVQLWDVRSQNASVLPLPLDNHTPQTGTWSADSHRVATAGSLAAVWDARSGERSTVGYYWHERGVLASRLDAPGDHVLIGLENGIAQIWSVTNAVGPEIEIHHQVPISALAFCPDGSRFVSASTDGSARLWHRASGEPATPFLRHGAPIKVAAFSPDGKYLLTGATDGRCLLWDATTGDLTTTLADHLGPILDGRFSDDGQLAITASEDHTARLWEIPGGAPLGGPLRHLGPVHSVDLTRDAKWAVTASEDKTARVWEVMTSQPMGMIVRHEAALVHAEFDPTDTWFLTASKDGVVRISEVATGHPVCEFAQPGHSLRQATFSPDGKWVLIASDG